MLSTFPLKHCTCISFHNGIFLWKFLVFFPTIQIISSEMYIKDSEFITTAWLISDLFCSVAAAKDCWPSVAECPLAGPPVAAAASVDSLGWPPCQPFESLVHFLVVSFLDHQYLGDSWRDFQHPAYFLLETDFQYHYIHLGSTKV